MAFRPVLIYTIGLVDRYEPDAFKGALALAKEMSSGGQTIFPVQR